MAKVLSKRDMLFSMDHTKNITRLILPPKPDLKSPQTGGHEIDTPIDTAFREERLNDSNADENELEEIRTLKDIWDDIKKNTVKLPPASPLKPLHSKDNLYFCVEFDSHAREVLSFPVNTLIRKKVGEDYILSPIDEVSENDQIIYIQTNERERTIEDYLLRVRGEEMSLEEILEPLLSLKSFYETLNSLDFKKDYDETKLKSLHWLSAELKESLFYLFRGLLNKDHLDLREISILSNSIWREPIRPEKLIVLFNDSYKRITYSKLYDLAVMMGLRYTENSFKVLCSTAIHDHKHYYFRNENNLLAIGRLVGHNGIIENYQIINEKGSRIGTFLQMVGLSIKRVTSNKGELLNEIDNDIEARLKKCTVVKVGEC